MYQTISPYDAATGSFPLFFDEYQIVLDGGHLRSHCVLFTLEPKILAEANSTHRGFLIHDFYTKEHLQRWMEDNGVDPNRLLRHKFFGR